MRPTPYIGITDFTAVEQVDEMLGVFRAHRSPDSTRRLHIGVMMSHKTLYGHITDWADAFPPKESIGSIFRRTEPELFHCLHYADYEHSTRFSGALLKACRWAGPQLHALQLDMVWPSPYDIEKVLVKHPSLEIILQVGADAICACDRKPKIVLNTLKAYEGIIHHVLFDMSMGRGHAMHADVLLPYVRRVKIEMRTLGIAVAGGLGPGSVDLAAPIAKELPSVSIDAQGRLRPSGNALDPIDWHMAAEYLREGLALLP